MRLMVYILTIVEKHIVARSTSGNCTDNTLIGRRTIFQNMIIENEGGSDKYLIYH
jgi:hypothetical protein